MARVLVGNPKSHFFGERPAELIPICEMHLLRSAPVATQPLCPSGHLRYLTGLVRNDVQGSSTRLNLPQRMLAEASPESTSAVRRARREIVERGYADGVTHLEEWLAPLKEVERLNSYRMVASNTVRRMSPTAPTAPTPSPAGPITRDIANVRRRPRRHRARAGSGSGSGWWMAGGRRSVNRPKSDPSRETARWCSRTGSGRACAWGRGDR